MHVLDGVHVLSFKHVNGVFNQLIVGYDLIITMCMVL
jgi:hypothetical protein